MPPLRVLPRFTWPLVCALAVGMGVGQGLGTTPGPEGVSAEGGTAGASGSLPAGAVMRLGTSRFWHRGTVLALALSRDGKQVASLGEDNVVRLWDADTGREVARLPEGKPEEPPVPPGGGLGGVLIGDGSFWMPALRFSPDGKTLAVGDGVSAVRLWDLSTRKPGHRIGSDPEETSLFAFSPDGKTLATAGKGKEVRLYSVATGKEVRKIKSHEGRVRALAYSADGRTLVTGSADHTVRLWESHTGKERRRLVGHRHVIQGVAISPDGRRIASVSADTTLRIWDADTGKELRRWKGTGPRLAFSADGATLIEGGAGQTILWEVATGNRLGGPALSPEVLEFGLDPFQPSDLSADGRLAVRWELQQALASGEMAGGLITLVELATGKIVSPAEGRSGGVAVLAWSPDGKVLASGSMDSRVTLWDSLSGRELLRCAGHTGPVTALAFHPDGRLLASACCRSDQAVSLWDTATGKEVRQFRLGGGEPDGWGPFPGGGPELKFSPDGRFLVCQRQALDPMSGIPHLVLRVWEVASGKSVKELNGQHIVSGFSPDGKYLVALGYDKLKMPLEGGVAPLVVRRWEVGAWKETAQEIPGLTGTPGALGVGFTPVLSPDARLMVRLGAAEGSLEAWDLGGGRPLPAVGKGLQPPALGGGGLGGLAFAGGFGGLGLLGGVPDSGGNQFLSFAPHGRALATALSPDGTLSVWEIASGGERCKLPGNPNGTSALSFAPDGRRLASGSLDGTVLIWDTTRPDGKGADARPLADKELDNLWADLAARDAALAYRALCRLGSDPARAVGFLQTRLKPAAAAERGRIDKLLADLNSDAFATRQASEEELKRLGGQIRPLLEEYLKSKPPLEVRRRVQGIVAGTGDQTATPERFRQVRAVEVLERANTPEARGLLETLARGAPGAGLTVLAEESLSRLRRHPAASD